MSISLSRVEHDIPLKAGDQIYGVYQSCIQFNQECDRPTYYIRDFVSSRDDFPFYRSGRAEDGSAFEYVSDDPQHHPKVDYFGFCSPVLTGFYLDAAKAEKARKAVYVEAFKTLRCRVIELTYYSVDNYQANEQHLKAWAKERSIQVLESIDQVVDNYQSKNYLAGQPSEAWSYYLSLLTSLEQQQRFDELYELWELSNRRPLAFIKNYEIDRDCYLRRSARSGC